MSLYEELVMVSGGMPFCAENDGQVSFAFPVGFAGQQPPSPKEATLPNAAASFQPAQGWQVTVSYEIFQTPKSV